MKIKKYIQKEKRVGIYLDPNDFKTLGTSVNFSTLKNPVKGFLDNRILLQFPDKLEEIYEIKLDSKDIRALITWKLGQEEYKENQKIHEEKEIESLKEKVKIQDEMSQVYEIDRSGESGYLLENNVIYKCDENGRKTNTCSKLFDSIPSLVDFKFAPNDLSLLVLDIMGTIHRCDLVKPKDITTAVLSGRSYTLEIHPKYMTKPTFLYGDMDVVGTDHKNNNTRIHIQLTTNVLYSED